MKISKVGMSLIVMMIPSSAIALFAQTPEKSTPMFALTLEEEQLSAPAGYKPTDHELLVKYTNVSDTIQHDYCMITPNAYKINVLRDGIAAEKRKPKRQIKEDSEERLQGIRIKVTHTEQDDCRGALQGLQPGQTVKFPLWVSSDYDMTVPGTYEITVTRETDPEHPEKSVTVKSNTITITVLPADEPPPAAKQ